MSWVKRWQGKNVHVNPNNPSGLGICDYSGYDFNHKDLVKQMEWRGNALVWTGFLVGPQYADKPQEQNRPPLTRKDPEPILNARFPISYSGVNSFTGAFNTDAPVYTDPETNPVLPNPELMAKLQIFNWNS